MSKPLISTSKSRLKTLSLRGPFCSVSYTSRIYCSVLLEVIRENKSKLLHILFLGSLRARHNRELHRAKLLREKVAALRSRLQLGDDELGDAPGRVGVRFERLEYLCGRDGVAVLPPGVVVRRGCDEGVAGATYI